MNKLTKAEEEVMHIVWKLKRCIVSQILDQMGEPRPPHSTISSIVRILEKKGFVDHKAYGRTYEYFPIIKKEAYSKATLKKFVQDYFQGSMNALVSFMVKEEDLSVDDLNEMIQQLEDLEEEE